MMSINALNDTNLLLYRMETKISLDEQQGAAHDAYVIPLPVNVVNAPKEHCSYCTSNVELMHARAVLKMTYLLTIKPVVPTERGRPP